MSSTELAPKVIGRQHVRKTALKVASVKMSLEERALVDTAASILTQQQGTEITRSDILYTGTMRFVRQVLGLPEAA